MDTLKTGRRDLLDEIRTMKEERRLLCKCVEKLDADLQQARPGRDKQVETATRLQLIQVTKEWRDSGQSRDQLIFRLRTTHINIPDTQIKKRGC